VELVKLLMAKLEVLDAVVSQAGWEGAVKLRSLVLVVRIHVRMKANVSARAMASMYANVEQDLMESTVNLVFLPCAALAPVSTKGAVWERAVDSSVSVLQDGMESIVKSKNK